MDGTHFRSPLPAVCEAICSKRIEIRCLFLGAIGGDCTALPQSSSREFSRFMLLDT